MSFAINIFYWKFSKIIIFVLVFFLYVKLPLLFPNVKAAWDKDICLDSGVCREGTTNIKDKHGKFVSINKENCINNGYKWYEKDKSCDLRKNR